MQFSCQIIVGRLLQLVGLAGLVRVADDCALANRLCEYVSPRIRMRRRLSIRVLSLPRPSFPSSVLARPTCVSGRSARLPARGVGLFGDPRTVVWVSSMIGRPELAHLLRIGWFGR